MDDVRVLRPQRPQPKGEWRRWIPRIIAILLVVVVVGGAVLRFWVDYMWFDELNQTGVFTTRLRWSLVVGAVVGVFTCAALLASLTIARRVARNDMFVPFLQAPVGDSRIPDQPVISHIMVRPIALVVSIVIGVIAGAMAGSRWETVLGFVGRTSFGQTDPQFGRDLSFYVFTVPMLELVVGVLQAVTVVAFLVTGAAYIAMGVIRYLPAPRIARPGAIHLASLVAVYLVCQAASFRLAAWNLVHSEAGYVTGAGYTDVHVRLPAMWLMMVVSVGVAIAVVVFARQGRGRRAGIAMGVWIGAAVVTLGILPAAVQKVSVDPNELAREQKVIAGNIKLTRYGYGLSAISEQSFTDKASLSSADFAANTATTSNIRLWSPDVLNETLEQIQEFRPYYNFVDVDVDRYRIGGRYRQVMLSAREVNVSQLGSRSWVNEHLQYTHGYGVVGSWPDRATRQGRPELFLRDIPPVPSGQDDLTIKRPEIYFGEQQDQYVMVGSREREFDYPDGDDNKFTSYKGDGGIPVSGSLRRLAFAATFGDQKLLLTGSVTGDSRIMFRRNVRDRVEELAPFLHTDSDPYIVIRKDGSLVWVIDAYTTSDRLPYSTYSPLEDGTRLNYVRNSVKAVVDAYDGGVTLYDVSEGKDPILATWRNIFPKLFVDGDTMPKELVAHLRYPEDLFSLQTDKWLTYHMGQVKDGKVTEASVQTFYNREDVWASPELDGAPLEAFYVLAKLPTEKTEEMLLVRPIVPAGKKNLIAYMGARMDPGHYGEIFTLKLSKQSLTQGPQQVSARIRQDKDIAQQIRLWTTGGTKPRFGNMLVLPIEQSLLYVQPIYLESTEAQLPEFERVVLVLGDTIAWGDDFQQALTELLRRRGEETAAAEEGSPSETPTSQPSNSASAGGSRTLTDAELREVVEQAGAAYEAAQKCQREGDWACYGRESAKVGELLQQAGSGSGG